MTAIGLLRDMGSTLPKMLYIQWQLNREMKDDLADNALDSLRDMGKEALQPMLENLNKANEAGQEALLDVLANFPGHENVYQLAVRLFEKNPNRRALFASYLAKLGDRARADSHRRRERENCRYMDLFELLRRHPRSWVAKRRSASSTTTRNTRRCTRWTTGTMTRRCSNTIPELI